MKRTLAILMVLMLVPCFVFAETIDATDYEVIHEYFANYSTDDLLLYKKIVDIELEYRGYNADNAKPKEFEVPAGKYTVGVDIPAGVYTISHGGGMFGAVIIVGNYEAYYPVMQDSPVGKLELTEGKTIEVQMSGVKFTEYKGLGF